MRKMKAVILCLAVICLLGLFSRTCFAGEAEDFAAAGEQGTTDAWQSFLDKYPAGPNADAARAAFDALLVRKAESATGNTEEIEVLFKQARTAPGADKLFGLWDEAAWRQAKTMDTIESFRKYLLYFPGGKHTAEARAGTEEVVWRLCRQKGDRQSCEEYLNEYPAGAHAQEARELIADSEYQQARQADTIEAYEKFLGSGYYGDSPAAKRLRQLIYERAVKTGKFEDWVVFLDRYQYSGWGDDGPEIAQMRENARKEIERALYEKILAAPTLELCREYINRYYNGVHKQQVIIKMEPFLHDEAARKNESAGYFEYLGYYPEGYQDKDVRERLEALIFKPLDEKEDFSTYRRYLGLSPKDEKRLKERMEPLMGDWARRVNTVDSLRKYLGEYPDGPNADQARALLEPLLYQKARDEDWYSAYEEYIRECPKGKNVGPAKERIAWLKANRAVMQVEYPQVLEQTVSPYSNVGSPFWGWDTVFKETSGNMGFRMSGNGYIEDTNGQRWVSQWSNTISRSEIRVPAGGSGKDSYWTSSTDHGLCNGYAVFTWTGEDAGGHPLQWAVRVKLQHTDCPGYKKVE